MKLSMILGLFTLLIGASPAFAESYNVVTLNADSCQAAGHPSEYVLQICDRIRFNNGDRVVLSGTHQRSNLEIRRGDQNLNPYYMPLGVDNANYSVDGDIDVVLRNGRRHALVYRLNYQTYDGQTGFQIITVRLGTGFDRVDTTCTRFVYDSNRSTLFTGTDSQKETAMRAMAHRLIQENDFQSGGARSCLNYDHNHGEERGRPQISIDSEEGDNLEAAHP